jgi:hypothetical protein
MHLNPLTPKKSINKAYLKEKVNRADIERFKTQFISLLDKINDKGDEEHLKSLVADFLKFTWYQDNYQINPIGKNDLVIHTGKTPADPIGVIIEVKSPTNKPEMLSEDKPNAKAMHELVLYYLRERITNNKHDIKQLIATNIYEWFVFDANEFDKKIYRNTAIKKLYEQKMADNKDNPWFYDELSKLLKQSSLNLDVTYFDIRSFKKWATNNDAEDDKRLIALYKILSPVHLLKLPFANDSNTLQPKFYSELLHIIGLYEYKDGSKKLISRKKAGERNAGSLLENAIVNIEANDKMSRLDRPGQYGDTYDDRLYTVALELVITWINRILFLKLLEAQLLKYHKGDKSYTFLNKDKIKDFDGLNKLFFRVLAVKTENRAADIVKLFGKVPYLNSSLFETTELEHETIGINALENDIELPALSSTVLKDDKGKTFKGTMRTIDYLFEFLNAYDFSSEGAEDIQEDNKTLINASVLGLIFEKIKGYKDGSFFTPGFITMYMCRETIRRAVVQKFNEAKGWELKDYSELYDLIKDKKEANDLINSLKICDPAVGSGHFLVSALNELIAIKSDLNILMGTDGRTLRDYTIEVVNDELIVSDENGDPFAYNYHDHRSQIVQQTIFHEKQTIIENCLFGVDINPNSVKICRLRLWIELLKNAYYKPTKDSVMLSSSKHDTESGLELETLPNIDINIKIGNSLISRFALDADLKQALKKSKYDIDAYKLAVQTYREAKNKEEKREMEKLIATIKSDFRSEISKNDPKILKLNRSVGELYNLVNQKQLFGESRAEAKIRKAKQEKLEKEVETLTVEVEEIKTNKVYENAFEWRFEFPEVLSDEGGFNGFDAIIGNPPYIRQEEIKSSKPYFSSNYSTYSSTADLYVFFTEKAIQLLKVNGQFSFIMPNKWMRAGYGEKLRQYFLDKNLIAILDFGDLQVFDEATTYPCILEISKAMPSAQFVSVEITTLESKSNFTNWVKDNYKYTQSNTLTSNPWNISSASIQNLISKLENQNITLHEYIESEALRGILTGLTEAFVINKEIKDTLVENEYPILHPFVLGRNVKPFLTPVAEKYLIKFEKGFTNKHRGELEAEEWIKSTFPEIYKYLLTYKSKAIARTDKGDYWWELRACDYYEVFNKPKIMYQVMQVKPCFIYDENGLYCNNSMWFIPSSDKALLGILNSKVGWFLISNYCTAIQNGFQLIWQYLRKIPLPEIHIAAQQRIINLVDQILIAKQNGEDTTTLETQIDQLVYQLYNLTPEEIKIVEGGA